MTTYVRTQEIDHEIGRGGQFALRVTSPDVEMRAVDGDRAHVRATFEIRAATDAEADEIFERRQAALHRASRLARGDGAA